MRLNASSQSDFSAGPRRIRLALPLFTACLLSVFAAQGCQAQSSWPLWESYARHSIDPQGRVIDHTAQDHTTSEGQAYGMFFALVANDRTRFDLILSWTGSNLAQGDLTMRLPAWSWGRSPEGQWKTLDPNPASDADLWMAYDLFQASRLWHDDRYQKIGNFLLARIAHTETAYIPGLGTTLLPAPTGFHPDDRTWIVNPSYLPPFILAFFAKTQSTGPWSSILQSLQQMLTNGSGAGFAMDWVAAGSGIHPSLSLAQLAANDPAKVPVGSYDAIRVYLWLGISDPATPGVQSALPSLYGMANYLKGHVTPPEQVDSMGRILSINAPPGFSAALIPWLHALNLKAEEKLQTNRLADTKDASTGLYGHDGAYYDQNLALFSTGWSEQRLRFDRDGNLHVQWR